MPPTETHAAPPPHVTAPTAPFFAPRSIAIIDDLITNRGVPKALLLPDGATAATGTLAGLLGPILAQLVTTLMGCLTPTPTPAAIMAALNAAGDPGDAGVPARFAIAVAVRKGIIANASNFRDRSRLMSAVFQPMCASVAAQCAAIKDHDIAPMLADHAAMQANGTIDPSA